MTRSRSPPAEFFHNNGLSLALLGLFAVCLALQAATGFYAYNTA